MPCYCPTIIWYIVLVSDYCCLMFISNHWPKYVGCIVEEIRIYYYIVTRCWAGCTCHWVTFWRSWRPSCRRTFSISCRGSSRACHTSASWLRDSMTRQPTDTNTPMCFKLQYCWWLHCYFVILENLHSCWCNIHLCRSIALVGIWLPFNGVSFLFFSF